MVADVFGLSGQVLDGAFRIDAAVGEGGFAVVYKGQHLHFDVPIAIKCLKVPPHFTSEARTQFLERFRNEARVLAKLGEHANIVGVYHFGVTTVGPDTEVPYLVMEWLTGEDLEQLLIRQREEGVDFSETGTVALLLPAVSAIALAHSRGVAHCDLKPANLFVATSKTGRRIQVLDFGIAKAMQEGERVTQIATRAASGFHAFSPGYGAPEQFFSKKFGATGPWTRRPRAWACADGVGIRSGTPGR